MIPESTLEELETAHNTAVHCLTRLLTVKTKIDSQPKDLTPSLLVEAIREPSRELLESWRALYAVSTPHVERDYIAACEEPFEIGSVVATSAHSAVCWVSHQAIVYLSIVLMPAGCWPSTEDPKTDCFLADFRSKTPVDASEYALRAVRTGFDEFSIKDLRKCLASVAREFSELRRQLSPVGYGRDERHVPIPEQTNKRVEPPPGTQRQTAKDRETAFDKAISSYANSDWTRDRILTNKAFRVRKGLQKGKLFGVRAKERGWYQSRTGEQVIKKDGEGVWVYLTAPHSKELKKFFSAFVD